MRRSPSCRGKAAAKQLLRRLAKLGASNFETAEQAQSRQNDLLRRLHRRRFETVCNAWKQFQASRARDALYPYLAAVAAIVEHYKGRRKTSRLLRHAFKLAGLQFDENADPFTAVFRCTCDRCVDNKTISKWSRSLRCVAYCKVPCRRLKAFMKEAGGVNACAARYARYYGRGGR